MEKIVIKTTRIKPIDSISPANKAKRLELKKLAHDYIKQHHKLNLKRWTQRGDSQQYPQSTHIRIRRAAVLMNVDIVSHDLASAKKNKRQTKKKHSHTGNYKSPKQDKKKKDRKNKPNPRKQRELTIKPKTQKKHDKKSDKPKPKAVQKIPEAKRLTYYSNYAIFEAKRKARQYWENNFQ